MLIADDFSNLGTNKNSMQYPQNMVPNYGMRHSDIIPQRANTSSESGNLYPAQFSDQHVMLAHQSFGDLHQNKRNTESSNNKNYSGYFSINSAHGEAGPATQLRKFEDTDVKDRSSFQAREIQQRPLEDGLNWAAHQEIQYSPDNVNLLTSNETEQELAPQAALKRTMTVYRIQD